MAGGFELLAAYIKLSTRGFDVVRTQLLRLKRLSAELGNATVVDLDTDVAVQKLKKLRKAVKAVADANPDAGQKAGFRLDFKEATREASAAVRDFQAKLNDASVPKEIKVQAGVGKQIRLFQDRINALKDTIQYQLSLNDIIAAGASLEQIEKMTDAFRQTAGAIADVAIAAADAAAVQKKLEKSVEEGKKTELNAARAAKAAAKQKKQDQLDAYLAAKRSDLATLQALRDRLASGQKLTQQERNDLRASIQTADGIAAVNRMLAASDRKRSQQAIAEFRRRLRIKEAERAFNARVAQEQQQIIDSARASLSALNTGSIGSFSSKLNQVSTAIKDIAKVPASTTGFLGSLGGYARSLGGLVSLIDGALPIMDAFGAAIAAIGTIFSAVAQVFSVGFQILQSVISVFTAIARTAGTVISALARIGGQFVSLTLQAIRPAVSAVLDFIFPLRGLITLLGDIKRRLGPFLASFLAFKGLSAITTEVVDFEKNIIRTATLLGSTPANFSRSFAQLSAAASQIAARTVFTTEQVSASLLELAKAGFDANTSISLLTPTLSLATLASVSTTDATNIFSRTLQGFALTAADATNVMDALVSATRQSPIELGETGLALSRTAATARSFGISLNDTLAILVKFGDVGIRGERAATALARGFENLVRPTKDSQKAIQEVLAKQGKSIFDFFDDKGVLRNGREGLLNLVDAFNTALRQGDLTNSNRTTIFGAKGRETINLFTDSIDQKTGLLISARAKLEQVLAQISSDRGITKNAIQLESAGFSALAERISGQFVRLGQTIAGAFGGEARAALIQFLGFLERVDILLRNSNGAAEIISSLKERFNAVSAALSPLIGFILRMNTVLAAGVLLTISEIVRLFSGPFLSVLQSVTDRFAKFVGLGGSGFLNSWKGTFAFLQFLTTNFSTIFALAIESIKQKALQGSLFLISKFLFAFNYVQVQAIRLGLSIAGTLKAAFVALSGVISESIKIAIPAIIALGGILLDAGSLLGLTLAKGLIGGFASAVRGSTLIQSIISTLGGNGILQAILAGSGTAESALDPLIASASGILAKDLTSTASRLGETLSTTFSSSLGNLDFSQFGSGITAQLQTATAFLQQELDKSGLRAQQIASQLKPIDSNSFSIGANGIKEMQNLSKDLQSLFQSAEQIQKGAGDSQQLSVLTSMANQSNSYYQQSLRNERAMIQALEHVGELQ